MIHNSIAVAPINSKQLLHSKIPHMTHMVKPTSKIKTWQYHSKLFNIS